MSEKRAWFMPTSPRSPEKIKGELKILKDLEGQPWDSDTQAEFTHRLVKAGVFEGTGHSDEPQLTARDRINRGPRMLGLVVLPRDKSKPMEFSDAGNELLDSSSYDLPYLFQRQLAKVQFPSYLHGTNEYKNMLIKPLTAMIYLINCVESLSKEEIALFGLPTINFNDLPKTVSIIKNYRAKREDGNTSERKKFRAQYVIDRIKEIYREEISTGKIFIREGNEQGLNRFILTKWSNLRDYADATTRYLRATGLFTLDTNTQRLKISDVNRDDAIFLLDKVGLAPIDYKKMSIEEYIKRFLGNPTLPSIRKDNKMVLEFEMKRITDTIKNVDHRIAKRFQLDFLKSDDPKERRGILVKASELTTEINMNTFAVKERENFDATFEDIKSIYTQIKSRVGIIDRPVMYEWNTWRALNLLDHAKKVIANLQFDLDGSPLSVAGGNKPDIIVEYDDFWLLVEVTLQSGYKQYVSEGESIIRHVGNFQSEILKNSDRRPVYGAFISEKIHDEVINYLNHEATRNSQVYNGYVRILPLEREKFEYIVHQSNNHNKEAIKTLKDILEYAFEEAIKGSGEIDWIRGINTKIEKQFEHLTVDSQ